MGGLNCYTLCTSDNNAARAAQDLRPSVVSLGKHDFGPGDGARFGRQSESFLSIEGRPVCGTRVLTRRLWFRQAHSDTDCPFPFETANGPQPNVTDV